MPERCGRQHGLQCWQQARKPGQGIAPEDVGLFADLLASAILLGLCIGKQVQGGRFHGAHDAS
ncbi:hypothetical protein D3C76_1445020 [compost metagenome]